MIRIAARFDYLISVALDNGPELTAEVFVEWAERHGIKLLFIQPGKPNQNAFIERFNRSFRQEVLDAWLFNAVSEVQTAADDWLTDYNECRPHDSLGSVPPAVFKPRVFNQEVSSSGLSGGAYESASRSLDVDS
ncbi:IS3 family transposase [Stenotrophomonas maltophilia]|nr:IS3 family transposase [Stenotrophomonas maltophilia]MRE91095.1 IS3 family transposase [Stenotrophomonas sp. M37]MRF21512.1 IS3 family transposase [Stenotrophomonas sp. MY18]MRF50197.1 IS3 family transposase [Stenotrophomonas sp. MY15]MRG16706.1 IS3 family transposase [Stenotrophomonas sp. MY17]